MLTVRSFNCVYNIFLANLHVKMNKRGDFDCMQPILRKILRETKHQNPLLYLKEVDYTDLQYDLSLVSGRSERTSSDQKPR